MHECAINRRINAKKIIEKRQKYLESIKDIKEIAPKIQEIKVYKLPEGD